MRDLGSLGVGVATVQPPPNVRDGLTDELVSEQRPEWDVGPAWGKAKDDCTASNGVWDKVRNVVKTEYMGHFFKLNFIKANFIKVKAAGPLQPRLRLFVLIEVYDPYTNDFNLRCFSFTEV